MSRIVLSNRAFAESVITCLRTADLMTCCDESYQQDVQELVDIFDKKTVLKNTGHIKNHFINLQKECGWTFEEVVEFMARCQYTVFPWTVPADPEHKYCFIYEQGAPVYALFNVHTGYIEVISRRKTIKPSLAQQQEDKKVRQHLCAFYKYQLEDDKVNDTLVHKVTVAKEPTTISTVYSYMQGLQDYTRLQNELAYILEQENTPTSLENAKELRLHADKTAATVATMSQVKMIRLDQ